MSDKHLDDYLPVIAIDVAVEEKTRIAKMAAATLHKLHNAMRQMRDWQNDSAKLRSNIWRMKMALRADDKNEDDNARIDPLIVYQKAEISRLMQANDALENEVTCLKRALTTTEDDVARIAVCEIADKIARLENEFTCERERLNDEILCLRGQLRRAEVSETAVKDKLEGFAREDRTIGAIFANSIGKIVVTVVGLSEELVNVSENLCKFKTKNRHLRLKLDRLRSMLRSKCGNGEEYRKRIDELNDLAGQLMGEMGRLKVIRENTSCSGSLSTADIPNVVRRVERLMNDLGNNLKNDREAMIAAGDPDCLRYMKKVANLRVNLKVLSLELKRSNVSIYERSRENVSHEKYLKTASLLNDFLQEIDTEIGKLKIKPMDKYCRIGGISGSRYMTEIAELENIVRKSASTVAVLKQNPLGIMNTNEAMMEEMKKLEDSIEQLCRKLGDVEIFDDRASLCEKICHFETLVAQLKSKLMEKDERIDALNDECANIRSTLERSREKYEKIIVDMREDNKNLHEDIKRKTAELSRKREHSEQRVAEMQSMKVEIDGARKRLQVLQDDKETLFGETEEMRNILRGKDKEIENIITQRDTLKGFLRAEMEDLKMKLGIASDENVKLRSIIEGLGEQEERERSGRLKSSAKESDGKDRDNGERSRDRARNLRDELECLKAESNESKISPDEANKRVDYSKCELDRTAIDDGATRPTGDTSDLESNEQSLTYRLNVRTSAGEETSGEFEVVMAENKALEGKVKQLRYEKEQLETELSELRSEKGLLDRSTADANNKCAALQDQVNKFKSERNGLRGKISEHEAAAENLKFELKSARAELEEAAVKMARLRLENSRVVGDFDTLSLRNTETEDRVRVLLAEKNELTTRINEIDDGNVALRDQLNKAKAKNEYFSMELNKSRVENDEAKARNALLRITCDERERDNGALRRERDEARGRLDEIVNERKMLDNQLKIQRIKYEALRFAAAALHHENDDRKSHLKEIDTRYSLAKDHGRGFASPHNDVERERNYSDATCTSIKVEIAERRDGVAELKVESDTCAARDNKAKIKDKPKDELKRPPGAENKALKLERSNFGSENPEITMELTRASDVLVSPLARTELPGDAEIIGCISKKFAIVNNRRGREMGNYSSYPGDPTTIFGDGERSTGVGIDRLEVENRTLKMKVDILRKGLDSSLTDDENTRIDLAKAAEEIRALKLELMNLRDERATLRSRLEMFKEELNSSGSEMAALKDELVASRKSNLDLRLKVNDLRGSNEKLKETNAGLESRLKDTSEEMSERIAISEVTIEDTRNNFSGASNDNSKGYTFARRNLRKISKRNRIDSVSSKNLELQSIEENLQHIEGQL